MRLCLRRARRRRASPRSAVDSTLSWAPFFFLSHSDLSALRPPLLTVFVVVFVLLFGFAIVRASRFSTVKSVATVPRTQEKKHACARTRSRPVAAALSARVREQTLGSMSQASASVDVHQGVITHTPTCMGCKLPMIAAGGPELRNHIRVGAFGADSSSFPSFSLCPRCRCRRGRVWSWEGRSKRSMNNPLAGESQVHPCTEFSTGGPLAPPEVPTLSPPRPQLCGGAGCIRRSRMFLLQRRLEWLKE